MSVQQNAASSIGHRATAGSNDEKSLISEFQVALLDEIKELKGQKSGRKTEVYDGQRIFKSNALYVYRFLSDDADEWYNRKLQTELTIGINGEEFFGRLDSIDKKAITITFDADMGEVIEEAVIQDSSFFLLEKLNSKLENIKSGQLNINTNGSMKLFGFSQPNSLAPLPLNEQLLADFHPNYEQEIAMRKALSQEVTFIWGPPGTGKTKTLAFILGLLSASGKKILLTANTNAAVDEMLKKFLDDKQNLSLAEQGKVIRLGVPTSEDEKMALLVPRNILEKRAGQSNDAIASIQKEIEKDQQKILELERQEKEIRDRQFLLKELGDELLKIQNRIETLRNALSNTKNNRDQLFNQLTASHKKLEDAEKASVFKRLFSGTNKEKIQEEIKYFENKHKIAQLEVLSIEKEFYSLIQEEKLISAKLSAQKENDQTDTLDTILKKKTELIARHQNQENEISVLKQKQQEAQKTILKESSVIATTIARACIDSSIMKEKFDVLIVDEASMAPLPNIFYLAGLCSTHYVISGDFRQLSPIAQGRTPAVQKWLKRDIFQQSGILQQVDSNVDDERLVMLKEQYRMHPAICNLISEVVYDGKLKTPQNVAILKEQLAKLPPFEGKALIFCDTATTNPYIARPKNSFSRISPYSAVVSANLALRCVQEAAKKGKKIKVGIVSPYNAQAKLISRILSDKDSDPTQIVASTIHRFQGSERDCIIFDLVEGEPLSPGKLTQGPFKRSEPGRLINVAISRAIGKFILVGNSEYIAKHFWVKDAVPQVLEQIKAKGEIIDSYFADYLSYEDTALSGRDVRDTTFTIYDQTNFYETFLEDMKKAKSRIVIFSPFVSRKRVESLLADFQTVSQKGIPIYVITRKTPKNDVIDDLIGKNVKVIFASKGLGFEEFDKFHFKLALVDSSVVYYGSLNILAQLESAESMMAFRTKKTVNALIRYFGIDGIIKEYLTNQNTNCVSINQQQKQVETGPTSVKQAKQATIQFHPVITLQKTDISNPETLTKAFGTIEPGKDVRKKAQMKLWKLGNDAGFNSYIEYEVPNLLQDGVNRFISVVWKEGPEIKAAFQIRRKKRGNDQITSLRDMNKLTMLPATEKYLVNISQKTGAPTFFKVNNSGSINSLSTRPSFIKSEKTYSVDEVKLKYARAYESWTKAEENQLISEYKSKIPISEIARIHQRKRNAIGSRLKKLIERGLIQP
ncbi:MAG: AAA domain-containing protein [Candidatus Bathyarchaeia archaeon]